MTTNERYMRRCLELAENGFGSVAPNPLVGSVIVADNQIIGEGFHRQFGSHHAEVNAIHSVKDSTALERATLYVNLEPCSHHGKTPPCSNLIIEKKIPRVVIGAVDPNPDVNGGGIAKLMSAGVEVSTGILEEECLTMNRRFYTFHRFHRPYIILKWAQTKDGFLAPEGNQQQWITNENSKRLVHQWRTQENSIMVGTNTALIDNPQLTARLWKGTQPTRIVLDRALSIPQDHHLFDGQTETIVFSEKSQVNRNNLTFIRVNFDDHLLQSILKILFQIGLQSLIVEGGSKLLNSFIENDLWDEARVFTGQQSFKSGLKAPKLSGGDSTTENIDGDQLQITVNSAAT